MSTAAGRAFPVKTIRLIASGAVGLAALAAFLSAAAFLTLVVLKLLFPRSIGALWILPAPLTLPACLLLACGALAAGEKLLRLDPFRPAYPMNDASSQGPTLLRRCILAILSCACAWAFYTGSGMAWASSDGPNGTRYKVSPTGVVHILRPLEPVSPQVSCWWFPRPGGEGSACSAFRRGSSAGTALWLVRPLFLLAALAALAAVAGLTIRSAGRTSDQAPRAAWIASALASTAGVTLFMTQVDRALPAMPQPVDLDYGGIGFRLVILAILTVLVCAILTLTRASRLTRSRRPA